MRPAGQSFRVYGSPPYNLVLVHGGPGAAGYLAPVAEKLSRSTGIIEAFQTGYQLDALVRELQTLVSQNGNPPVILLGHSWGAWLSLMLAARHPVIVGKLILVASAPLEEKYVPRITEIRMSRLGPGEKARLSELAASLETTDGEERNLIFGEISRRLSRADSYEALESYDPGVCPDYDQYRSLWNETENLRRRGELLRIAERIRCPVLVIHGTYDPHPSDGIRLPLEKSIGDFRFILLENCGHEPWTEKHAASRFFEILEREIMNFNLRDGPSQ